MNRTTPSAGATLNRAPIICPWSGCPVACGIRAEKPDAGRGEADHLSLTQQLLTPRRLGAVVQQADPRGHCWLGQKLVNEPSDDASTERRIQPQPSAPGLFQAIDIPAEEPSGLHCLIGPVATRGSRSISPSA